MCMIYDNKNNNLVDGKGNVIESGVKKGDVPKKMNDYQDAANQKYPGLSEEEALARYLDELIKSLAYENNFIQIAKGNYTKKVLKTNIDFLDDAGETIFRTSKKDYESFIKFTKKKKQERRVIIDRVNKNLKSRKDKYNPKNAKEKGYDVPISKNGTSPDFEGTKYLYNDKSVVKIQIKGSRDLDFKEAFKQIGVTNKKTRDSILEDYTWHHLDDLDENLGCTMQLVLREAHEATYTHFGSAGQSVFTIPLTKYLS
ncbi:HNH endonuclease [Winogradskyella sp.]|uniref:HNH endonuclease n=1 Tax=Winogradskyella sp. TaxID=1883156 RepID=UPI0026229D66|nr:HNH endonuclease [Winogradskyella sp.]